MIISALRDEFELDPSYIHLSCGTVSSHPRCVRHAIAKHRRNLDRNPALYIKNREKFTQDTLLAAATYLNTSPSQLALTESTTMGLSLLYHGLLFRAGDEIISTVHDHYATQEILRHITQETQTKFHKISLYTESSTIDYSSIIKRLNATINENTRLVALTWVHSCTGVKLPIAAIGKLISDLNKKRGDDAKILFCVDGVHALGIEDFNITDLNCDFFVAGCHKSLWGPRGTGIIWGTETAWKKIRAVIPSFDDEVFLPWLNNQLPENTATPARFCNPGGFVAFENRWALAAAFDFHQKFGKNNIAKYIHDLNQYCKNGLLTIPNLILHTPLETIDSSGMICFEILNTSPSKIVSKLLEKKIIAGQTPYTHSYARLMPSLINSFAEIDTTLQALSEIAQET